MASDIIRGFYHKSLAKEIERVLGDCKSIGLFISKKLATAIIAEKSKRYKMQKQEIIDYLNKLEKGFGSRG